MISSDELVDVTQEGTILLGPDVICDGFYYGAKVRVQSHVHTDHMQDFSTSKGLQTILMSHATYDLIVLEKNAEIPNRITIKSIGNNTPYKIGKSEILILDSGHMLGAIQTQVTLSNGKRIGYSGDFNWPLTEIIKVDTLIVDCTGGSSKREYHYTQEDANLSLIELVVEKLRQGPIMLKAYRGTLQHALTILSSEINVDLICPPDIYKELEIYQKHSYNISNFYLADSKEGRELINSERYIYICDTRKHNPAISLNSLVTIQLSAYMTSHKHPVLEFSNKSYRVALSGHADFDGTLAYINATGAEEIITDNTRAGHAIELAEEIKSRLNINARPSSNELINDWYH